MNTKKSPSLQFLKLGGSLITEKDCPSTAREETLKRIAEEIAAAENLKGLNREFSDLAVTKIALLMRYVKDPIPEKIVHGTPLQTQKLELRSEINRAARTFAIKRNAYTPDFAYVWRVVFQRFGVKSLDDLHDNHSMETMRAVLEMLREMLVNYDAAA